MRDFEVVDPVFATYLLGNAGLEKLAGGFRWTEGPVWFGDHGALLFNDLPRNRTMRWTEAGVDVFRAPSDYANGQARDRQGRLVSCSHRRRCLLRTEHDGRVVELATHFAGRRLNSPNDVVVKSDGTVWFSDPVYGISTDYEGGKQASEIAEHVWRLDPSGGLTPVVSDVVGPNGLCFSPDERRLYVAATGTLTASDDAKCIRVYDVRPDGTVGEGRFFARVSPGFADGFACDEHGNLWTSAGDGVRCLSPEGRLLERIKVPATVSNVAFGGLARDRLFICASDSVYAIFLNVRGATWP